MSELINDTTLAGRIAVVTGASSGIGEATARQLAARGAKVALLARRADRLQDLADKIEKTGGTALALSVDVTDADAVGAAAERIRRDLGTVDLLVNNAGVMLPAPVEELRTDQWQRQIDLNITGLMNVFGAFLPQLVAAGTERGVADLVNVSSIAAKNIFPNFAVYSATKAYVTQLSRHLRAELGEKHVRVSAIEPGMTHSELHDHVTDRGVQEWTAGIHDIMLHSEDIAETIVFTVSLPPRANLQQVTIMPTGQPA
ncbi:SDR family oxidoreductase [Streptomyces cadmiisoli]|uniref:SDR family NAD(P)-dependent oxidoreductase n=1 Tax=Streptomyces cadmiisoli TaxID=2184053 RepID=A0A2Z4JF15_9ACTN|nr:SDR family oxidoreductase [Streptomyces cadmiisoli]AWW43550.1 SDR family NAD(P)-dependent oxidoreductase [Streptomyces cadmiisoli]